MKSKLLSEMLSEFSEISSTATGDLTVYGVDSSNAFDPAPAAVVWPRSSEEVSAVLRWCEARRVAVVPSGGRTGLSGGAVAANGEVVISLEKMNRIGEVDTLAGTLWVEAGAITEHVHQRCGEQGLMWPIAFAATGSSHIGGNIATNAGGVHVLRYGSTRKWVLGLKVVTMSGQILDLGGALEKDNTGIDLKQLFIGSEGILGVVTEATLKLCRPPVNTGLWWLGVKDLDAALSFLTELRKKVSLQAFEFMTANCVGQPPIESHENYILVEAEDEKRLASAVERGFEQELVVDGCRATSSGEQKKLWGLREGISEGVSRKGWVRKLDVALPVSRLGEFYKRFWENASSWYPSSEIYVFGHLGDGNLHINVLAPQYQSQDEFLKHCESADTKVYRLIADYGGSVSAEHGIGLLKKSALSFSKSPPEVSLMKNLKQVFDPKGLLNPGKVI